MLRWLGHDSGASGMALDTASVMMPMPPRLKYDNQAIHNRVGEARTLARV